ncbi:MAG: hypothetical protein JSU94_00560 [Phycisphaerales bacterium]|nr:MAG: hypothetical protein JSU94_00560 [Phycisphaerales bacterium]
MKAVATSLAGLFLLAAGAVEAFDGHVVTEGPLRLTIGDIADITETDKPRDVAVTLRNDAISALEVELQMAGLVDTCYAVGPTTKKVSLAPGAREKVSFQVAAGRGTFSALYPVHVYAGFEHDGRAVKAHAVQIFKSNLRQTIQAQAGPPTLPANVVPPDGSLPLWQLRTHRIAWRYYDKTMLYMPVGWRGSEPESSASFAVGRVDRGSARDALIMHPPWKPAGGTIFVEYLLKLPNVKPITLNFANAIRDHTNAEPPSDGVTFRVWAGDKMLFERHTLSKKWLEAKVDLTEFAGEQVLLRLESHPGPARDTTCDSSYWAEPTVTAGALPAVLIEARRQDLRERARQLVVSQESPRKGGFVFDLDDGCKAALVLGGNGLMDSAIAFGAGGSGVVFDGLTVSVLNNRVGSGFSPVGVRKVTAKRDARSGRLELIHRLSLNAQEFDLTATVWKDGAGLRIRLACPKRITDFALGPADRKAPRVYYGHGYCILEPKPFKAHFGGHNLSTSHVGFDFAGGPSLLVACDNPPDYLDVDPARGVYSLHTHMDATMTFVPGRSGAFDCARRYRPLYDKRPAPGFRRKAGRMVFDIWGGKYADIARTMQKMIAYGLTDSLLTLHVWQRWGYDYRLPDIYPPMPRLGSIQDMQKIAEVCAEHDIPWGLHDNYIDFYPDAEDYSYDHICFTEQGEPVRAWLNEGRNARSYRWRPDRIMPFVRRNLKLIKPNLRPTHYFIDVFTSLSCFDYYDRHGNYHSSLETRRCWGEVFAWIRDYLGDNAPTTSEAGHDQLVGYLDGSDCQHLTLSPQSERFCIKLPCKDWERVPWFDAVLHNRFSLHGVGYPSRYKPREGQSRQPVLETDDYISAEILTGHAMMIDNRGFGRGAVRKYWLAQDFIRSIAADSIESVEFVDGDIHRQIVTWKSGAKAYVNRGEKTWTAAGKELPQDGYFAKSSMIESSIEKIGNVIVEQSRGPSGLYFNARGLRWDGRLPIRPEAERVEYLGGRRFRLIVKWRARRPAPKDLAIFLHFNSDASGRSDKIAFQGDQTPPITTGRWIGLVKTGADRFIQIPPQLGPGQYEITVGLWDPATGTRYALDGDDDGTRRYRLGTLVAEGTGRDVTNVRLVRHKPEPSPPGRWNLQMLPIDFGPVVTEGAFRCTFESDSIVVTPLPDIDSFNVALRLDELTGGRGVKAKSVLAVDADGREIRSVEFETTEGLARFRTGRNEFAYRIAIARPSH